MLFSKVSHNDKDSVYFVRLTTFASCVRYDERDAARRAGSSATAETCFSLYKILRLKFNNDSATSLKLISNGTL